MLPFISRASEIMSKRILVEFDNSRFLLNFDKSIFSKNIEKQSQSIAKLVNIEFMENKNSFSEQEWKELYKLSEETFVDESDSLKKKIMIVKIMKDFRNLGRIRICNISLFL